MNEQVKIEEVDAVEAPPKARVENMQPASHVPDYLEGFYTAKPVPPDPNGPDGALYEAVMDSLKEIYDPEIPVNIVDLGLIYGVEIDEGHVKVTMTLTTPHCPVAESMPAEVEIRTGGVPGVGDVEVSLVWDPPWGTERMTDEARLELGML